MSSDASPQLPTIGFYLWPNMTMLDVLGPQQVLGMVPGMRTFTFARDTSPLVTDTGITLIADHGLADVPQPDVLVVGGGANPYPEMSDPDVIATLARLGAGARYVTSVCTGSLILAEAGLLDGYRATTHWSARELLAAYPGVQLADGRVVQDRNRITGGGVSAGIDFALTLLGELVSPDVGRMMELVIEYRPEPPFGTGGPDLAPPEFVAAARASVAELAPELAAFVSRRTGAVVG